MADTDAVMMGFAALYPSYGIRQRGNNCFGRLKASW